MAHISKENRERCALEVKARHEQQRKELKKSKALALLNECLRVKARNTKTIGAELDFRLTPNGYDAVEVFGKRKGWEFCIAKFSWRIEQTEPARPVASNSRWAIDDRKAKPSRYVALLSGQLGPRSVERVVCGCVASGRGARVCHRRVAPGLGAARRTGAIVQRRSTDNQTPRCICVYRSDCGARLGLVRLQVDHFHLFVRSFSHTDVWSCCCCRCRC